MLSDVDTEAANGRFDTRLYNLSSPLTPTKHEEEEKPTPLSPAKKGLQGPPPKHAQHGHAGLDPNFQDMGGFGNMNDMFSQMFNRKKPAYTRGPNNMNWDVNVQMR